MQVIHLIDSNDNTKLIFNNSLIYLKNIKISKDTKVFGYIHEDNLSDQDDTCCVKIDNKCYKLLSKPVGKIYGYVDSEIGLLGVCVGKEIKKSKVKPLIIICALLILYFIFILIEPHLSKKSNIKNNGNVNNETNTMGSISSKPEKSDNLEHGANVLDYADEDKESSSDDNLIEEKEDETDYVKKQLTYLSQTEVFTNDERLLEIPFGPFDKEHPLYVIKNTKDSKLELTMSDLNTGEIIWVSTIDVGSYGYFNIYRKLPNGSNKVHLVIKVGEDEELEYTIGVFIK